MKIYKTIFYSASVALGIGLGLWLSDHYNSNHARIRLSGYSDSGHVGAYGQKELTVKKDEKFSIGYSIADSNGLENIIISQGRLIIDAHDRIYRENQSGIIVGGSENRPGMHEITIEGKNMKGGIRKDTAILYVLGDMKDQAKMKTESMVY